MSTEGGTAVSHTRTAESSATANNLNLLTGTATATLIRSECTSNGDGSTGSTTLAGLGGAFAGLSATPAPNTTVAGVGSVTLNEQVETNVPGSTTSIVVNAMHIELAVTGPLPGPADDITGDVIVGQSRCRANGPDVLTDPDDGSGSGTGSSGGAGGTPGSAGSAGTLPFTGSNPWLLLVVGLGLLGAGVVSLLVARRLGAIEPSQG